MNFLNEVLSFIYPEKCEICQKNANNYICENCKKNIENSKMYLNKIESYKNDNTKYFNEHAYLFSYTEVIREKIIKYKFDDNPYLAKLFFDFFIKSEKLYGFFKKYDIIIPVPMKKEKIRTRGYNQTEIIAKLLAKNIKQLLFEKDVLIKYKNNMTQSTLTRLQRLENVKNVYKVQNEQIIKEKNILILDDIYTTGATCNECAKTLKNAGCKNIGIVTIAKDLKMQKYKQKERK